MKRTAIVSAVFLLSVLAGLAEEQAKQAEAKPDVVGKVRAAVERYVQQDQQLKGGFFLRDPKDSEVRELRFDYVHKGVERTPDNLHLVCVDFLDRSDNRLDIDFYLKPAPSGELQVSKIKTHKVNGVERKEE